jgi:hypothetical protein
MDPNDVVGGHTLQSLIDDEAIVEKMLSDEQFLDDTPDVINYPGFEIRRYYALLPNAALRDATSTQIANFLTHSDPLFRHKALLFFYFYPIATGAAKVLDAAIHQRSLYRDVPRPTLKGLSLENVLFEAIEMRAMVTKDNAINAFLREELLGGSESKSMLGALSRFDWDWVESNLTMILSRSPKQLRPFISELENFPPPIIVQYLKKIRTMGSFSEEELQAKSEFVWETGAAKHNEIFAAMGWE